MKSKATKVFLNLNFVLAVYITITVVASVIPFFLGDKGGYTHYNNYVIFKQSFYHLIQGKDLFILYPNEQWDLYKYSPAFALFFGVFAWLPDIAGGTGWNLLNMLALYFAIKKLPVLNDSKKALALWFVLIEDVTSIQNFQSNALIAGLLIFCLYIL